MRDDLVEFLCCVAKSGDRESPRCAGGLVQRDEITLICAKCSNEYPIHRGVPRLLNPHSPSSSYMDDPLIQLYYEMHFGRFLTGSELDQRWSFPQPGLDRNGVAPSSKSFDELRQEGRLRQEGSPDFYGAIDQLATCSALTEEFYQTITELCQPYLEPESVVLDIGCGLGRMVAELAHQRVARVIGVDLSPRMVEEAAALLTSNRPVPVRLNLAGGRTISATLDLNFSKDAYDFLAGDATCLPIMDSKVDLALCLNLVDRVKEPRMVEAECRRILRPGGKLLISDPYDWEGDPRAIDSQPADMGKWFDQSAWRRIEEIDGVPFVLRRTSRRIILYLNHCIVYERIRNDENLGASS